MMHSAPLSSLSGRTPRPGFADTCKRFTTRILSNRAATYLFPAKEPFTKVQSQGTFTAGSLAHCAGVCKNGDMRWNAGTGRSNYSDLYTAQMAYQRGYIIGLLKFYGMVVKLY